VLLVLHEEDSAGYTKDPERDWAGLATEGVDVEVLPGGDHAMLEEPGVERLAAILEARLAACLRPSRSHS
jgi:thioesterase domain-containing protein